MVVSARDVQEIQIIKTISGGLYIGSIVDPGPTVPFVKLLSAMTVVIGGKQLPNMPMNVSLEKVSPLLHGKDMKVWKAAIEITGDPPPSLAAAWRAADTGIVPATSLGGLPSPSKLGLVSDA